MARTALHHGRPAARGPAPPCSHAAAGRALPARRPHCPRAFPPLCCVQYAPYAPPAYGSAAGPPPPYYPYPGTPAYGTPAYAYGQPAYGAAPYGQPAHGHPAYGVPPTAAGPAGMPPTAASGSGGQPTAAGAAAPDFANMSVHDLKAFIRSRGANLEGAVEKADLVAISKALYTP